MSATHAADPSGGVGRRVRLAMALELLPTAVGDRQEALRRWIAEAPGPVGAVDAITFEVALRADAGRVTISATGALGDVRAMLADIVGYGDDAAGERLARAWSHLEPERGGAWLEASGDGLDAGWILVGDATLAKACAHAPASGDLRALTGWAEAAGALRCTALRRSVGEPLPATELVIALPGGRPDAQLPAARAAFEALGVPWLGDETAEVLAAGCGELALVAALTADGAGRLGIVGSAPSTACVLALASAGGLASDAALASFEGTLGGHGPARIVCARSGEGFEVELIYALR